MAGEKEQPPPQPQGKPDEAKLQKSIVAAKKVVDAQQKAASLKEQAMKAVDPRERIRLWREAYNKEVEAHGQSKYAQRLQSGVWQGGAAGGGIGAGVALGLGSVVAGLVSGLVAVPTTLVGGLVGAGVGAINGPFIKFGGGNKEKKPMSEDEQKAAAMKEANRLDAAVEKGASTVPQPPPELEEDMDTTGEGTEEATGTSPAKKKPRKLQVRSGNEMPPSPPEKRKPRKIEVRSGAGKSENG